MGWVWPTDPSLLAPGLTFWWLILAFIKTEELICRALSLFFKYPGPMVCSCTKRVVNREWTLKKCQLIRTFLDLLSLTSPSNVSTGKKSFGFHWTVMEQSFGVFLNSGLCSPVALGLATTALSVVWPVMPGVSEEPYSYSQPGHPAPRYTAWHLGRYCSGSYGLRKELVCLWSVPFWPIENPLWVHLLDLGDRCVIVCHHQLCSWWVDWTHVSNGKCLQRMGDLGMALQLSLNQGENWWFSALHRTGSGSQIISPDPIQDCSD